MKINICFVSDNNYIGPLSCAIISILENANDKDELCIFIFEDNISYENKNKILSLKKIKKCEINFIKIDNKYLNNLPNFSKHLSYISKTACFRFFIADILKDIDKIIYLDCDVIVLSDLKTLFVQDIHNYYLGAIEDMGYYCNLKIYDFLKIYDMYVNSGVLLINLELWRQDNISSKIFNVIKEKCKDFIYIDQDSLNFTLKNKIKVFDFSYNMQTDCLKNDILLYHPKKEEIKNALKKINIIHYTTNKKPWNCYVPLRKYYLFYEKFSPFAIPRNLTVKIKFCIQHVIFLLKNSIWFLRYLISPIITIYKEGKYIRIIILKSFKFNLIKYL